MTSPPRIILASGSRYRRELIERLGLRVESIAPPYDEEAAKRALGGRPVGVHVEPCVEEMARHLARGKAASLATLHPEALVIGSDQMGELDGVALHKPGSPEAARAQLRALAGRAHRQVTAVAVLHGASGRCEEALDVHRLVMRPLTDAAIEDYVRRDQPLDCAGSYRIESLGVALFESIAGEDYTGVIGLPLTKLVGLLQRYGVAVLGG